MNTITIQIPDYKILEQIYESSQSIIYKAISEQTNQNVIIKIMRNEYPSQEELTRFQREFEITQNLKIDGVVHVLELKRLGNRYFMVQEDFDAISLNDFLNQSKFSLQEFLELAPKILQILGRIHNENVMHKDIKPANIIWNRKTGVVKFIDFGISTKLSREISSLKNPGSMEGTLAYMSPEQTGRMNRGMDYRTDFYSLGITFFYLLTGKLPFQTKDSLEMVHCHIAKSPPDIVTYNNEVPEILSKLILKLLSKTAEERYQSASGILFDIQKIYQMKNSGKITDFPLAEKDFSFRFQIPQKFYGREKEVESLLKTFDRVSKSNIELVLVAGYSGIGKSSVIQELHKPILAKRGNFISGKFDQFKRNIPYAAFIAAFKSFIEYIQTESEEEIELWKERIQTSLGVNGALVLDILPELEAIIGKCSPVSELPPTEAQNRFNLVLQNFIKSLSSEKHPLVIFLDDLQWADPSSLKILELLLNDEDAKSILIIGAYRDNEVDNTHILIRTLAEIKDRESKVSKITLSPLGILEVTELVSDTLKKSKEEVKELSDLVLQKTGGNPFFLTQFLQTLYEEKLIQFDEAKGWNWEIDRIQKKEITNNIVELVSAKINKLSKDTIHILKIASCIGNTFDLKIISMIEKKSIKKISEELWEAMAEGLIIPLDENYKFITEDSKTNSEYKFIHDRVQQAAYSSISEEEKTSIHHKIGNILLMELSKEDLEENLFDIANHLNLGSSLVYAKEDKLKLARFNLEAGNRAKASIAYKPALEFYKKGIQLLDENSWKEEYDLSHSLFTEAGEAAYWNSDLEEMTKYLEVVFKNSKTVLDKVKAYEIKILSITSQGKLRESVDVVLEVLELLGVKFPKKPNPLNTVAGLLGTKIDLGLKKIESLLDLPKMKKEEHLAAMKILTKAIAPVFISYPELMPFIVFRRFSLSVKNGNSPVSAFAYADYGLVLCGVVGDIEAGYKFGQLAMNLLEKFETKEVHARTHFAVNIFIRHWKEHIRVGIKNLLTGYYLALETGDYEFGSFLAHVYTAHSYYAGKELNSIEQEMESYSKSILQMKQMPAFYYNSLYRQVLLNLMGRNENPILIKGEAYDEEKNLPIHMEAKDRYILFNYYLQKLNLCYLFGEYEKGIENAANALIFIEGVTAMICIPLYYFYLALCSTAIIAKLTFSKQKKHFRNLKKALRKFKSWSVSSPSNHAHKYKLLEAEYARLNGKILEAADFYEQAIQLARDSEYIQEEALANELCGKFFFEQKKEKIAKTYLAEAVYLYKSWGAIAKSRSLASQFSIATNVTLKNVKEESINITKTKNVSYTSTISDELDIATILKSSQVISGEIDLEKLLSRLMDVIIENAGAEKGFLVLKTKDKWFIEAEVESGSNEKRILHSASIDNLPASLINFVLRTKETIVLNDAASEIKFKTDAYIQKNKPKSVMCIPLIKQSTLTGIIYLENNLLTEAFTSDRIEILKMLSGQIAISIENARLYSGMKELNKAYERFVPAQFLAFLNKESIVDVKLGNQVEKEMTVLFSDIRSFTSLSEKMSPQENFNFLNSYLSRIGPIIRENNGFIDKFIGDAIMALFPTNPDEAVRAAIVMLQGIKEYNRHRASQKYDPISIGIGLHTGKLMLGTIGEHNRMDGTVISDSVNLASRVEGMTKQYDSSLLITDATYNSLKMKDQYKIRVVDKVQAKGKSSSVTIYEVFDADHQELIEKKLKTQSLYESGLSYYQLGNFESASECFIKVKEIFPTDKPTNLFLERCKNYITKGKPDNWQAVEILSEK
ncbi:MAG: AAA family ATPase [Leptospiraceae bacterium]|nr:AAA family ATPase [Leptospiraceae bacterium]